LQCVALCCSVLQCVVVCCSVLQVLTLSWTSATTAEWSLYECVAACNCVLQCVAVCCSYWHSHIPQLWWPGGRFISVLQRVFVCDSVLQLLTLSHTSATMAGLSFYQCPTRSSTQFFSEGTAYNLFFFLGLKRGFKRFLGLKRFDEIQK